MDKNQIDIDIRHLNISINSNIPDEAVDASNKVHKTKTFNLTSKLLKLDDKENISSTPFFTDSVEYKAGEDFFRLLSAQERRRVFFHDNTFEQFVNLCGIKGSKGITIFTDKNKLLIVNDNGSSVWDPTREQTRYEKIEKYVEDQAKRERENIVFMLKMIFGFRHMIDESFLNKGDMSHSNNNNSIWNAAINYMRGENSDELSFDINGIEHQVQKITWKNDTFEFSEKIRYYKEKYFDPLLKSVKNEVIKKDVNFKKIIDDETCIRQIARELRNNRVNNQSITLRVFSDIFLNKFKDKSARNLSFKQNSKGYFVSKSTCSSGCLLMKRCRDERSKLLRRMNPIISNNFLFNEIIGKITLDDYTGIKSANSRGSFTNGENYSIDLNVDFRQVTNQKEIECVTLDHELDDLFRGVFGIDEPLTKSRFNSRIKVEKRYYFDPKIGKTIRISRKSQSDNIDRNRSNYTNRNYYDNSNRNYYDNLYDGRRRGGGSRKRYK